MKSRKEIAIALSSIFSVGTSVFAHDSTCPDYPGHRDVLDQGTQIYKSSPDKPSSRRMPAGTIDYLPRYVNPSFKLRTVDEYLKEFNELKKEEKENDEKILDLTLFVSDVSLNLFSNQKYKVCREFLEAVLSQLPKEKRNDFYDVLGICYLAKEKEPGNKINNSTYLNQLVQIVETKSKLTESEKSDYSKAKEYFKKALETPIQEKVKKDRERILRLGLLSVILGEPEEASKFGGILVENFKKRTYIDSEELFRTSMRNSLRSTFFKYPSGFLDEQAFPAYMDAFSISVDGTIVLCKSIGDRSGLVSMSELWARELSELDLMTDNHVEMIKSLPESFKSRLLEPKFSIGTIEFEKIYKAMKARGWSEEASSFEKQYLKKCGDLSNLVGVDEVTQYYLSIGNQKHALALYENEITRLKNAIKSSESNVGMANLRMKALTSDLKRFKVPSTNPTVIKTKEFAQEVQADFDKLECLKLAEELCLTGWNLIECGDGKNASKMYESALDIRRKKLHPQSRVLGTTYFGAAQAAALDNNYPLAQDHFQKAIAIFKSNHLTNDSELVIALENYGSLLNKNNKYDEAQKVYDEVRAMRKKSPIDETTFVENERNYDLPEERPRRF